MRALWFANNERGEELGQPNSTLDMQADEALGRAIGRVASDDDLTSDWE
jgi:hypothetical protein